MKLELTEASVSAAASKFTYGGGTMAFFGGLTANEVAAFGGLLVAVVGLLVQWHYKRKDDKRKAEQHKKFMAAMILPPRADDE
jgi:positive regulator of sigma E activity